MSTCIRIVCQTLHLERLGLEFSLALDPLDFLLLGRWQELLILDLELFDNLKMQVDADVLQVHRMACALGYLVCVSWVTVS